MRLRVIQWNVKINSNSSCISELLSEHIQGKTIINLQEVSENAYNAISQFIHGDNAFSLHHREPGIHEGRNRRMGVMTIVVGGVILKSSLVSQSLLPERTMATEISFDDQIINNLTFHSLTGVDYKKAKSSNFASLASYMATQSIDLFTCDANEPDVDSLIEDEMKFFDNRDKGANAELLFGKHKIHALVDTYKEFVKDKKMNLDEGFTYATRNKKKRYDFIYCKSEWQIIQSEVKYMESLKATSDHGLVVSDLEI